MRVLREESPDPALIRLLNDALTELDEGPDPVLFHSSFWCNSAAIWASSRGSPDGVGQFDLKEGRFLNTAEHSGHAMDEDVGKALAYLLEVPIGGASGHGASRRCARRLLDQLLLYYASTWRAGRVRSWPCCTRSCIEGRSCGPHCSSVSANMRLPSSPDPKRLPITRPWERPVPPRRTRNPTC